MSVRRTFLPALTIAFAALPLLAACGDLPVQSSTSSVAGTTALVIDADITSVDKVIHTFGADDSQVAGFNHLTGTGSDTDNATVEVELLALVDYELGSGSFDGVVTFTFADGSTITARVNPGTTTASANATAFESALEVRGGTGAYLNATGSGMFTGTRTTELGGAVQSHFTLSLTA